MMLQGRSPDLVVLGDDSCSKGHGFESRRCILDGHFFTLICCKNCNDVCLKRPKINEKGAGVGPFLKIMLPPFHFDGVKNGSMMAVAVVLLEALAEGSEAVAGSKFETESAEDSSDGL